MEESYLIQKHHEISLQPSDILVSFDVSSLFTNVPVLGITEIIDCIFSRDLTDLFQHVLTITYLKHLQPVTREHKGVARGGGSPPRNVKK